MLTGAENFNFAPKFPQNGGFKVTYFALLYKNFLRQNDFPDNFPTAQHLGTVGGCTPLFITWQSIDLQVQRTAEVVR